MQACIQGFRNIRDFRRHCDSVAPTPNSSTQAESSFARMLIVAPMLFQ
jgi:hypothetical protein